MIERLAFGCGHRRRILCRPNRFRPALQQKHIFAWRKIPRDGPFDILWAAIMTFDPLRNSNEAVELVVAKAWYVLLFNWDFFVDHSCTSRVRAVLAQLA